MKIKTSSFACFFIAILVLSAFYAKPPASLNGSRKLTCLFAIYPNEMAGDAQTRVFHLVK